MARVLLSPLRAQVRCVMALALKEIKYGILMGF